MAIAQGSLAGLGDLFKSHRQNWPFLIYSLAAAKTAKNPSSIPIYWKVDRGILSENLILFLLANLTGVIGGAFVLVVLQPPMDFFYLLPGFVLLGMIAANLVFAFIIELTKEPDAKTMREAAKQAG